MERERSLSKRFTVAGNELRAYWHLAVRYRTPHYFFVGIGETVRDFIAGKDTMLETASKQLREFQKDAELKAASDQTPYIQ